MPCPCYLVYNFTMPKQLIFVRHGHTLHNSTDHAHNRLMGWNDHVGLSDQGYQDARRTAEKLQKYHIDYAFHSDFIRTTETAKIISEITGIAPIPTTYLRERNLGNFAELTMGEIKLNRPQDWAKFLDHHDPDWNGLEGESLRDVSNRFHTFLTETLSQYKDKSVLLITHSGYIHTILRDYFEFFDKDSFEEVGHSSVTILEKNGHTYKLVSYNET